MPTRPPNIILLSGEDTGCHHGCYGEPIAHTPRIDALASQGRRYDRFFSVAPVCAPARGCWVSGRYPWSLGNHLMRSRMLSPPPLITRALRDAGYHVRWPTKTDFNFEPTEGWVDSTDDWVADLAAGRIGRDGQPFFLYRNFMVSHESTMWPTPRAEGWGGACVIREAELHRVPSQRRADPSRVPVPAYLADCDAVRADLARYFDALAIQDAQVGDVLDALDASGRAGDTAVIYLADHGRGLLREKRWCYDAGLRVPLIVRWPGRVEAGSVSRDVVSGVDVAATILAIADVRPPALVDGVPFLASRSPGANERSTSASSPSPARRYAFSGRDRMNEAFDRCRTCADDRYRYVRNDFPQLPWSQRGWYMELMETTRAMRELAARGELRGPAAFWDAVAKPPEELYDYVADPDCVRNLADDPAHADRLIEMRRALSEHLSAAGDLGHLTEAQLIDLGIISDERAAILSRVARLPERWRVGRDADVVFTEDEAARWVPAPRAGRGIV
jgi:N-sulfoglucosamine sulfohydrolase